MSAPDLVTRYVRTLIRTAQSFDWGADTICRKAGFRLQDVLDDKRIFSPEQLAIVVNEVSKRDEALGQIPGSKMHGAWPLMCELVLPSDTLLAALDRGFRFYDQIFDNFKFSLIQEESRAFIDIKLTDPQTDLEHLFQEWWPRMWHRFAGWLIGENIPLIGASFVHRAAVRIAEYEEIFGCPCVFEQPNSRLEFDSHWLSRPLVRKQEELEDYLHVSRIDLIRLPEDESSLAQQIRFSLHEYFLCNQNFPSIDRIAQDCHVSSQTLRRRLRVEGTSFTEIKEDIRKNLVADYLINSEIPISEVARLGGFAEPSGLARAVNLWFGVSPRTYRKNQRSAAHRASHNL